MKKRGWLIVTLAALAAGLWSWRYVTLNEYYHGLAGALPDYTLYEMGDTVPLTYDFYEGYSVRVDGFEIVEIGEIDPELFAGTYMGKVGFEGKIGLVTVTVTNDGSDRAMDLSRLAMRGDDTLFFPDSVLLPGLNDGMGGSAVYPGKGESVTRVVPYFMNKQQFPTRWKRLEEGPFYLIVDEFTDIILIFN